MGNKGDELPQDIWNRMPNSILNPKNFPAWLKASGRPPEFDKDGRDYPAPAPLSVGGQAVAAKPPVYPFGSLNAHGYAPTDGDVDLLSRLLFAEGDGTPDDYPGLGWATINRVGRADKGKTLTEVIHQKGAFQSVGGRLWNAFDHPDALMPEDKASREKAI